MNKTIVDLQNPDIIVINGEEYQIFEHQSQWFDFKKNELIMIVTLIKVGEFAVTPTHHLLYVNERPNDTENWRFYSLTKDGNKKVDIDSIKIDLTEK